MKLLPSRIGSFLVMLAAPFSFAWGDELNHPYVSVGYIPSVITTAMPLTAEMLEKQACVRKSENLDEIDRIRAILKSGKPVSSVGKIGNYRRFIALSDGVVEEKYYIKMQSEDASVFIVDSIRKGEKKTFAVDTEFLPVLLVSPNENIYYETTFGKSGCNLYPRYVLDKE